MKSRNLVLISTALLSMLLLGAFALNVFSAPPELKLKVKWKPAAYILDNPVPNPWNAQIYFAPPHPVEEIDPSRLLLEGVYSPSAPPYLHPIKDRLVVPFNGYDVLNALLAKTPHMGPGSYIIFLEITGQLYDGRYFRGSGSINMTLPELPPP